MRHAWLAERVTTHVQLHAKRSDGPAVLRVLETVHPGVKVNVSGALLDVEDDLKSSSFCEREGDVVRLDGLASVQDRVGGGDGSASADVAGRGVSGA